MKKNPFEKMDKAKDKAKGIKEGSPMDKKMDAKAMPNFVKGKKKK